MDSRQKLIRDRFADCLYCGFGKLACRAHDSVRAGSRQETRSWRISVTPVDRRLRRVP